MKHESIYLNHAGTSWPKPTLVRERIQQALDASPAEWSELFASSRQQIAQALGINDLSRLLLTPSCTGALSLAIADLPWRAGDQVLCSSMEHHALHRPLFKLAELGVSLEIVPRTETEVFDLEFMEKALKTRPTSLVAVTAASNVTGELLPLQEIVDLARQHGALVLVDAAQTAGWPIFDLIAMGVDLFAFAGHKGPRSIWGIGGLYIAPAICMNSLSASCEITSTDSHSPTAHCSPTPSFCDAGSVNLVSLASLAAGLEWLQHPDQSNTWTLATKLAQEFVDQVASIRGVTVVGRRERPQLPTVALRFKEHSVADVTQHLNAVGIRASGGLQCAPLAHRSLGTTPDGVLRFSFAESNHPDQIKRTVQAIHEALGK